MSDCADCNETTSGRCSRHAATWCPACGRDVTLARCPCWPVTTADGANISIGAQAVPVGWLCPACGGGNAPFSARCPCRPATAPTVASAGTLDAPPIVACPWHPGDGHVAKALLRQPVSRCDCPHPINDPWGDS